MNAGPTLRNACFGCASMLSMCLSLFGCDHDRITVSSDTTRPQVRILFPTSAAYDLNADGLLDLSVAWHDPERRLDLSSVSVRSLRPLLGDSLSPVDLTARWTIIRLDTGGLLARENIENLLPDGLNSIEVGVADSSGNRTYDTLKVVLPPVAFHSAIPSGLVSSTDNITDITLDSSSRLGFAAASKNLLVFDTDSLKVAFIVPDPQPSPLQSVVYDNRGHVVYAGENRIQRFDILNRSLLGTVSNSFATGALLLSCSNPDLLYSGEAFDGWLGYTSLSAGNRFDVMQLPHTNNEFVLDMACLSGDTKLYMTRYDEGGILVIDPVHRTVLGHVDSIGGAPFFTDKMALSLNQQHLYVALRDAVNRGVADLDTRSDSVSRVLPVPFSVPQELALSPSQRRLFVTTQDQFPDVPSSNVLIDIPTWRVVQELPRDRPTGATRRDGPIAFRNDAKLIFVGRDLQIDVYIHRESP